MAPVKAFTATQARTLAAVLDTFFPALNDSDTADIVRRHLANLAANPGFNGCQAALDKAAADVVAFCRTSASDLGVLEALNGGKFLSPGIASRLGTVLNIISSRVGMLALCGVATPFADLDQARREAVINDLKASKFQAKRQVAGALRGLALNYIFSARDPSASGGKPGISGHWAALGYKGPAREEHMAAAREAVGGQPEHIFEMLNSEVTGDTRLEFDVVVVGSGCGGAVIAAELAGAGQKVLVLEKGTYFPRSKLSNLEGDAFSDLYEQGGFITAENSSTSLAAGSTFGGGSLVNWACSLRTTDAVRQEWAKEHGLTRFVTDEFSHSLDTVCSRINVTSEGVAHNRNNQLFLEGCRRLGYQVETAPQNMANVSPGGAAGSGFISLGDRYGNKQSMVETFLRDAAAARAPARFADRCHVKRVLHEGGVARGVLAEIVGADGKPHQLEVRAPRVVISCGSINSPVLLLRSGLPNQNRRIGTNLHLHPASLVFGTLPAGSPDVEMWEGAPMTLVSDECEPGRKGDHYGCRLECPSLHLGMLAVMLAQSPGRSVKEAMLETPRVVSQVAMIRDRSSGKVFLDKQGELKIHYDLVEHDRESMLDGIEKLIRLNAAIGVDKIITTQGLGVRELPPVSMPEARASAVEELVAEARRAGFAPHISSWGSAHQMGTCRMGSSPEESVVDPNGENWEVKGLYVADASIFPTPSGTNPMVTTLALAHLVAQQMKKKLQPCARL